MKNLRIDGFEYVEAPVGPTDVPIDEFTAVADPTQTLAAIARAGEASSRPARLEATGSAVEPLAAAARYIMPAVHEGLDSGSPLIGHVATAAVKIAAELPTSRTDRVRSWFGRAPKLDPKQVGLDLLVRSFAASALEDRLRHGVVVAGAPVEPEPEAEDTLGGLKGLSVDGTNLQVYAATKLGRGIVNTHESHYGAVKRIVRKAIGAVSLKAS